MSQREWRAVCRSCLRPESVCYCRHITPVETTTRVVVLQHPRERDKPIGTARMATLCLPHSELHQGVRWDAAALDRVLDDPTDPGRMPVLLYPGKGAIDVMLDPPTGRAGDAHRRRRDVVASEEAGAREPSALRPPRHAVPTAWPSQYRIRQEPQETYVSTIEALVHVLGALEGDALRLRALLVPFRAMIDAQIACEQELHGSRIRHAKMKARPRRPAVPPELTEHAGDVVCVVGEANAWPYRAREEGGLYEDEMVHWVACACLTGELFERVVAPRQPLAPRTSTYVELTPTELVQRGSRWQEPRATGESSFATPTSSASGGTTAPRSCGIRRHVAAAPHRHPRRRARVFARAKVGTLDELVARIALPVPGALTKGRAGRRLAQITAVMRHFIALAKEA